MTLQDESRACRLVICRRAVNTSSSSSSFDADRAADAPFVTTVSAYLFTPFLRRAKVAVSQQYFSLANPCQFNDFGKARLKYACFVLAMQQKITKADGNLKIYYFCIIY